MKDIFKVGDLVEHTTLLGKLNRGTGVVVDILPIEYKVNCKGSRWKTVIAKKYANYANFGR